MPSLEIALFDTPSLSTLSTLSTFASRLEVCGGPYSSGGLTASIEVLHSLRQATKLPLHAMLRPRSGNFTYTDTEFQRMEADLPELVEAGASGIVFGIVVDKQIDEARTRTICEQAAALGAKCVFHRAFDEIRDWREGMQTLQRCGVHAVLTSGGEDRAVDGAQRLREMVLEGRRCDVDVIVGGGVRSVNVQSLRSQTDAEWFHSAALMQGSELLSEEEVRGLRKAMDEVE